jgi:hypothetical protein
MKASFRRTARSVATSAWLLRHPLFARPGHFYSPITGPDDVRRAAAQRPALAELDGIELNADEQRKLAETLAPAWPDAHAAWKRYDPDNRMFGLADGSVYQSMLTFLRPAKVIEVGSGYSSALALDVRDNDLPDLELTFIEPYPARLLSLLRGDDRSRIRLFQQSLQDVPLDAYRSLRENDILFIDSTHVSKAGSDVNWLLFRVLPILASGVVVHIHDIFFPFDYKNSWLTEGRSWNESYILRAFLTFNEAFEVVLFNSWLWQDQPELIKKYLPTAADEEPGSIWLKKSA